jgi:hypothetical protein
MVAPSAHHSGSTKSATNPNSAKVTQKIFRSTVLKSIGGRPQKRRRGSELAPLLLKPESTKVNGRHDDGGPCWHN